MGGATGRYGGVMAPRGVCFGVGMFVWLGGFFGLVWRVRGFEGLVRGWRL